MEKCPSSIWCQDLNTQPSEHEPPPITTRLGLPLKLLPSSSLEDVFRCSVVACFFSHSLGHLFTFLSYLDASSSSNHFHRITHPSPVWPYLVKFWHFGKSLQVFGKFLTVYFLFGKMLILLWQICDIIGLIFAVANGQILKNNLTIWSHCIQQTNDRINANNKALVSKARTCIGHRT